MEALTRDAVEAIALLVAYAKVIALWSVAHVAGDATQAIWRVAPLCPKQNEEDEQFNTIITNSYLKTPKPENVEYNIK